MTNKDEGLVTKYHKGDEAEPSSSTVVQPTPCHHQEMVKEFHEAYPHLKRPSRPTLEDYPFERRARLIMEEAREFEMWSRIAQEAASGGDFKLVDHEAWLHMIDDLCDILYVTYGAAVEMGVDLSPFFAEVHRANMTKVGGGIREDGKCLKPDGWLPPDLLPILEEQLAKPRMMWQVGVEGDLFFQHKERPDCQEHYCVPVDEYPDGGRT